jgi:uncharacterized protein (UPF0128 family)
MYIFSEEDIDFDVYARVINGKPEFFVAKIKDKESRRRFQTGSFSYHIGRIALR